MPPKIAIKFVFRTHSASNRYIGESNVFGSTVGNMKALLPQRRSIRPAYSCHWQSPTRLPARGGAAGREGCGHVGHHPTVFDAIQ